jgi:uncharacterized protein (DUF2236 family)
VQTDTGASLRPVVAQKVNGERLVILGWSRAILLQMAHPLIAAGVAEHSTFRGGAREAVSRMHGTIGAMLALTFGDEPRRDTTLSHIRSIHRRVNGTLASQAGRFPAGTPYSAEDPHLLLWVHATVLESIAHTYQLLVAPLDRGALDALCHESAPTLLALGGEAATAPRSWAALTTYIEGIHRGGVLHVTPQGREIADAVLSPRIRGVPMPGGSLHRLITIGLLPASTRDAYGFPWNARREKRLRRALSVLRTARRVAPSFLARWSAS